jgi:hypothetical protein
MRSKRKSRWNWRSKRDWQTDILFSNAGLSRLAFFLSLVERNADCLNPQRVASQKPPGEISHAQVWRCRCELGQLAFRTNRKPDTLLFHGGLRATA